MGELSYNARPAIISSMCTVFAESEVISLLNEGVNREEILSGVHQSIAKRVSTFVRQLNIEEKITFCGGVAKNCCVTRALEEELNSSILSPPEPQISGAVGAAIIAYEQVLNTACPRRKP
ncbi:MAG: hypothetical protein KJ939_07145 [Nanoarchaeota archaeon]|nr:hypothetical protein [Nanoarchaeota archaeon]